MSEYLIELDSVSLLGTVHASRNSRDTVQQEIAAREPDVVAVELDPQRHDAMRRQSKARADPMSLALSVLNGDLSKSGALISYLFIRHQSKIFDELDLRPGEADMLPAVDSALDIGADAALIDSEVKNAFNGIGDALLTPESLLTHLSDSDLISLVTSYVDIKRVVERNDLADVSSISEAIEVLETIPYDELEQMVELYETILPDGTLDGILYERNVVMAGRIHWLQQHDKSVLAVMGRMHVPGVQELLENPEQIPEEYVTEPPYI